MNNNIDKCCVCSFCGNPIRDPDAVDIGKKFFPDGDTQ